MEYGTRGQDTIKHHNRLDTYEYNYTTKLGSNASLPPPPPSPISNEDN